MLALARSDAFARPLTTLGAQVHRGGIEDLESLRRGAAIADAVMHIAFFHEVNHMALSTRLRVILGGTPGSIISRLVGAAVAADRRTIETLGHALAGPDRPLVAAFGTMAMKSGYLATEDDPYDPDSIGAPELAVLALASAGVRAGFVPRLIQIAKKKGV